MLVKIKRIGICGSDIHVYHGKHPYTKYPVTQGHEVSGQVAALGEGVTQFQVGQRVTIEPQVYCGECYPCTHGKYNLCENLKVMGFQTTGTASEYFAVDASKVTALPAGMSYDEIRQYFFRKSSYPLDEMKKSGKLQRGDRMVLAGFGGGLTYGASLIEY